MAKKLNEEPEKLPNHDRWLISYADFITLLMVFFIVMYAMSAVDQKKFDELAASLGGALSGGPSIINGGNESVLQGNETLNTGITPTTSAIITTTTATEIETTESNSPVIPNDSKETTDTEKFKMVENALKSYFSDNNLSANASMHITSNGFVLTLKEKFLFEEARADINKENIPALVEIARVLNEAGNNIIIRGYTDNKAINTSTFPSNWELSTARALQVLHIFQNQGGIPGEKLTALGRGEFDSIADNSTEQGRAANRRIEIMLESSSDNDTIEILQ